MTVAALTWDISRVSEDPSCLRVVPNWTGSGTHGVAVVREAESSPPATILLETGSSPGPSVEDVVNLSGEVIAGTLGSFAPVLGLLASPKIRSVGVAAGDSWGDLEMILGCDVRLVTTGVERLRFPHTRLGQVPVLLDYRGACTQLGATTLLELLVSAPSRRREWTLNQAVDRGVVDRVVRRGESLLDAGRSTGAFGRTGVPEGARSPVPELLEGQSAAARIVRDLVSDAEQGGDDLHARAVAGFRESLVGPEARAGAHAAELLRGRVPRDAVHSRPVGAVGVVGAGRMGTQIAAFASAVAQVDVVVVETDEASFDAARERIDRVRSRLPRRDGPLVLSQELETLRDCDVVIEAIAEDLEAKRALFTEVENVVMSDAVILSNTSSLSIRAMSAGLRRPDRVLGLHFFNPLMAMRLVEVVRPSTASSEAADTALQLAASMERIPIECDDRPGFVVNRLLMRMIRSCLQQADEGYSIAQIDAAIRGVGLPMGPFELLSFAGLEIGSETLMQLGREWPERFPPSPGLAGLVAAGHRTLFQPRSRVEIPEARAIWPPSGDEGDAETARDIVQAALGAMADEARTMLEDGTVTTPEEIDLGLLLGAGWPEFLGGICTYTLSRGGSLGRRRAWRDHLSEPGTRSET